MTSFRISALTPSALRLRVGIVSFVRWFRKVKQSYKSLIYMKNFLLLLLTATSLDHI